MEQPFAIGYTGSPADRCTGCRVLGNGYRWYDPALMRFTSSDSWSPFDVGGIHPDVYCRDDPINLSDPSGHAAWSWLGKAARRLRAAFPDGSIAARNSAVHAESSASKLPKLIRRLSRRGRSTRDDRAALIPFYREDEDVEAEHEAYHAAETRAAHAWANRMASIPPQAEVAAMAAAISDAVAALALKEPERRIAFVSQTVQSRIAAFDHVEPRLARSYSLHETAADTGMLGAARRQPAHVSAQRILDVHLPY